MITKIGIEGIEICPICNNITFQPSGFGRCKHFVGYEGSGYDGRGYDAAKKDQGDLLKSFEEAWHEFEDLRALIEIQTPELFNRLDQIAVSVDVPPMFAEFAKLDGCGAFDVLLELADDLELPIFENTMTAIKFGPYKEHLVPYYRFAVYHRNPKEKKELAGKFRKLTRSCTHKSATVDPVRGMSALPPIADITPHSLECPLIAKSGPSKPWTLQGAQALTPRDR